METLIFWHFLPNVIFTSKEIILAITFRGCHHDLVDHYGISVSQMTMEMFHLSQTFPGPFLIHDLSLGL